MELHEAFLASLVSLLLELFGCSWKFQIPVLLFDSYFISLVAGKHLSYCSSTGKESAHYWIASLLFSTFFSVIPAGALTTSTETFACRWEFIMGNSLNCNANSIILPKKWLFKSEEILQGNNTVQGKQMFWTSYRVILSVLICPGFTQMYFRYIINTYVH